MNQKQAQKVVKKRKKLLVNYLSLIAERDRLTKEIARLRKSLDNIDRYIMHEG